MRTTTIAQLPYISEPVFSILENEDSENVLACVATALTNLRLLLIKNGEYKPTENPKQFIQRMENYFANINNSNPAEIISYIESEDIFAAKNNKGFRITDSDNPLATIHEELVSGNVILLFLDAPNLHLKGSEYYVGHLCCLHVEKNLLCIDSLPIGMELLARIIFCNPNNFALIFSTKNGGKK